MIPYLATLTVLLFLATAHAATYYVTKGGNDTHSCGQAQSASTPRLTINHGMRCLAGGDTLIIGDGTWHEQLSDMDDREHPNTVRPPSGLSWSQPTVIKAANPRHAMLDKPEAGEPYNHVVMLTRPETRYISVEGLVLDGRGNGACVWVGPASHLRLQNNVLKNCGRNGLFGSVDDSGGGCQDIQLIGNEIFNISLQEPHPPGAHAIYFTGSQSVARGNDIHAPCPHYGIHYTSEHGGLYSNLIENNRVQGCGVAGIISQGADTTIRNNLLEGNCIGIYLSSKATKVLNNTIYGWRDCPDSYGILDSSGGSTLANNLVLQQRDVSSVPRYIYLLGMPALHNNLCDGTHPQNCQITAAAGSVVVDGAGGNLQLKAGGPAVNTGQLRVDVPTDRLGVTRPQGSAFDIGAYEYTTQAPPIDPPPGAIRPPSGADTTAPTATLTQPAAGPVSGAVTLTAEAADDVGLAGLQFLLDGRNIGPEYYQPPYQHTWDTTTTTPGPHTLSISARDAANNYGKSAPVSVTVIAAPPPMPGAGTPLTCVGMAAEGGAAFAVGCVPQSGRR